MRDWTDLKTLYVDQGLSTREIAKLKGVTTSANVSYHLKRQGIAAKPRNWRRMRHVDFSPSTSLSYVMGALYGDGWVSKTANGRIELRVTCKPFAEKVSQELQAVGLTAHVKGQAPPKERVNSSYMWIACAKSQSFCKWWHETNPFRRLEIALCHPTAFVRGLFDAEGSVFQRKGEEGPRIAIDCGRLEVMSAALAILKDRGYNCTSWVREAQGHAPAVYRIAIQTADHVRRFIQEFPSVAKRL